MKFSKNIMLHGEKKHKMSTYFENSFWFLMKFSYEMNFALLNFMWTTAILALF